MESPAALGARVTIVTITPVPTFHLQGPFRHSFSLMYSHIQESLKNLTDVLKIKAETLP